MGEQPDNLAGLKQLHRRLVLMLVGIFLVVSIAWGYFVIFPSPISPPQMEFSDAHTTGKTALCPGDTLTYSITLRVHRSGVYAVVVAIWRLTPPAVVEWEDGPRFAPFVGEQEYTLAREWTVPRQHVDPVTGHPVNWLPGHYERRHAIYAVNIDSEASIVAIPFEIRRDCE